MDVLSIGVLSASVINETRFQYVRSDSTQTVLDTTPSINVSGATLSINRGGYFPTYA